jgi:anaerobic selenocysteine-containing dehydrogenase
MQATNKNLSDNASVKIRTACNRDCPDACSIVATVENDRVVRLQGDADHPVTRGFLCYRTSHFLERQYDPDRITTPLIRNGSGLEPASWGDALDLVADKMLRIREESGPAAIMHYRCGGAMGLMKHVTDYFFERFGPVTVKSGDVCSGAGEAAQLADFGESESNDLFDLLNCRTIVLWGKNAFVSNVHLLPVLRQAKSRGARLILIDPVRHRTASLCDDYLQPRPGGDIALALGVARVLFETGRIDPGAAEYCDHLDEYRALAMSRHVATWAALADVSTDEIRGLAESYADGPSTILVGWGMQRRTHGSATIRVVDALGAISGNLGIPGGGVSFYFKRRGAFDTSFALGKKAAPRTIPEPRLGPGILEARDPEIRMVWITAGNPVAMLPESETTAEALRARELTVVVDSFLTDTARTADVVLPTTTMLEDDDLLGAYGHHWLLEMRPVVAPPDGVLTDYEISRAMASRVGLAEEFSEEVETWKKRLLGKVSDRGASLEDLRRGPVRNPIAPEVVFAGRKFPTSTGKVQLITEVDPEPVLPPAERPLLLMALATDRAQSSQWPAHTQHGPAPATVHPDAAIGFADGDRARLESETGSIEVALKLDPGQRRDIVLMEKGGWLAAGRCANALVGARLTDAGECAVYHDTPVRLAPVD